METIQDVIDLLRKAGPVDVPDPAWRYYRMEKAVTMLQEIARKQTQWINVKDSLPEDRTEVLFFVHSQFTGKKFMLAGAHNDRTWYSGEAVYQGSIYNFVTHWQPLPEPPEVR